jgi:hypothetical protein
MSWPRRSLLLAVIVVSGGGLRCQHAAPPRPQPPAEPPVPHFGDIMSEVGRRFELLGRAAKANRWELATYELGELKEAFDDVPKATLPEGIGEANIKGLAEAFVATHPPELDAALKAHQWTALSGAYQRAAETCNGCHKAARRGFIEVPGEPGVPVPRLDRIP